MGQSFSTTSNSVYVHLDAPVYSPGDTVSGVVLLNCQQSFQATTLVLKVEGYEKTRWEERREDKNYDDERQEWNTHEDITPRAAVRDFFKLKVPLKAYSERVNPGQYQFPFKFALPLNLPGSFEYSGTNLIYMGLTYNYLKAKVCYKVKAECEVPGMLKANLRHKARLRVHQRMAKMPSQAVVQDTQRVKACCCCDKGSASLTAQVEKDSYHAGDIANVIVQVDNQSDVDFKATEVQLFRSISLRTDGAGVYETRDKLASTVAAGVAAGVTQAGEGARRLSVQLPPNLQATTQGQFVQCEYVLEVRCKPSHLISDLVVKVPITIYEAPPSYQVYTQPPPGWSPELVAPPLVMELPSAPPLAPAPQQMMMAAGMPQTQQGSYTPPQPTYSAPGPA